MNATHPLEHLLRWLPAGSCQVVLDLGGGSGSSALHLARLLPNAAVFTFECAPHAIEACRASLASTRVEVVPMAVASHDGKLPIYTCHTNSGAASSLPRSDGNNGPPLPVSCTRLDTWCGARGIKPDIVWCDIEGDALAALQGLGEHIDHIRGLYVAVHYKATYSGMPSFGVLDDFLRAHGLHQILHQQSLPACWGYAIYARGARSESSSRAATQNAIDIPFARGGIGDLLQYLSAAVAARRIRVYSHFSRAADFFRPFGVDADHVPFEANTAFLSYAQDGQELERDYFKLPKIPTSPLSLRRSGRAIGLHPFGSGYSNTFAERFRAPAKWMSPTFVGFLLGRLLTPSDHLLVFCSPAEAHHLPETLGEFYSRATIVAYDDIWESLSCVTMCDFVIAVDSSVKTIASMLRIPTVTMVGDFLEPFRDRHFLEPYVRAGVMRTVRYQTFSNEKAEEALQAAVELLAKST